VFLKINIFWDVCCAVGVIVPGILNGPDVFIVTLQKF
jgi:hypothetical protein